MLSFGGLGAFMGYEYKECEINSTEHPAFMTCGKIKYNGIGKYINGQFVDVVGDIIKILPNNCILVITKKK
jgi:hypothetical protein